MSVGVFLLVEDFFLAEGQGVRVPLAPPGQAQVRRTDLPWAQELKQVWRFRDLEEKDAPLDLRNADGLELRQAVDWYSGQDRLSIGDPLAMGEDVFSAYLNDRQWPRAAAAAVVIR